MNILNQILCLIQGILDSVFGAINAALGLDIAVPDLGCEVEEPTE